MVPGTTIWDRRQISSPLEISPGSIIAVANHRLGHQGSRLWWSSDSDRTGNTDPIQMWSVEEGRIIGQAVPQSSESKEGQRWDQVQDFSFGSPKLNLLRDGTVLLMYYATIDDIVHIRACRFKAS